MPDDMSNKVDQIKNLLEDENMLENIKNVISMFSGGNSSSNGSSSNNSNNGSSSSNNNPTPISSISPVNVNTPNMSGDDTMKTVIKIKKIYDKMVNTNDPGITLLNSLKPYLNAKRKSSLETAIKAMHLSKISGIMHEIDE